MCDNQKDAIFLVDIESQRFLEVNKAALRMYGFRREEFLCMRSTDIFLEKDSALVFKPKLINTFMHKRKDGTFFPVEVMSPMFMWNRRRISCVTVRDVTGLEQAEDVRTE